MATVEDELAALKEMLDNDVINADEYETMSEKTKARHGVRGSTAKKWASQTQRAENPFATWTQTAGTVAGQAASAARDAADQAASAAKDAASKAQSNAGSDARASGASRKSTVKNDITWDELVENIGNGVASVVTGQGAKSKFIAALLCIPPLGMLGIHKFYLGYTKEALITMAITLLGAVVGLGPLITGAISLVEFFIYITRSPEEFERTYVQGHKGFF